MNCVVGVDPSISSTGIVLLGPGGVRCARVQSKVAGDSLVARAARMHDMVERVWTTIVEIADEDDIDLVVIEGAAYGSRNQMGHMLAGFWWMLVDNLVPFEAPIAVVQPSTLKKFATGDGSKNTGKREMLAAARRAFPEADITSHDVADAAGLAAMGAAWLGWECGGVFASSGMASVQSVRWPKSREG